MNDVQSNVDISGEWAAVGSPLEHQIWNGADEPTGKVHVYKYNTDENLWSREVELAEPGEETMFSRYGHSASLSGDLLAVGAPNLSGGGGVYVYRLDETGSEWVLEPGMPLTVTGRRAFGSDVEIKGDFLVIGDKFAGGGFEQSGRACIFHYDRRANRWVEIKELQSAFFVTLFSAVDRLAAPPQFLSGLLLRASFEQHFHGGEPDSFLGLFPQQPGIIFSHALKIA